MFRYYTCTHLYILHDVQCVPLPICPLRTLQRLCVWLHWWLSDQDKWTWQTFGLSNNHRQWRESRRQGAWSSACALPTFIPLLLARQSGIASLNSTWTLFTLSLSTSEHVEDLLLCSSSTWPGTSSHKEDDKWLCTNFSLTVIQVVEKY